MSQELQAWQTLGQWIAAAGTLAAVVVALFGDRIRKNIFPPLLELSLRNSEGEKTGVTLQAPDGTLRKTEGRWYHGRVVNKRRWSTANEVQVFLLRLEQKDASGALRTTWVGEIPIRWKHQEASPLTRTVGHPYDCDLCSTVAGKWVDLHPIVIPNNLEFRHLSPCSLVATFQARSIEADSNEFRLAIDWDGKWSDDTEEMKGHMVVRQVA